MVSFLKEQSKPGTNGEDGGPLHGDHFIRYTENKIKNLTSTAIAGYDDDEIYLDQETQSEEVFSFASEMDQTKHPCLYQIWFYDTFKNQFKIDLDDAYEMGSKKNNQLRTIIEKSISQLQTKFEI